jgi:hypothetical protein
MENTDPEGGLQTTPLTPLQLSVAAGVAKKTLASHLAASVVTTTFGGQSNCGG